MEILDPEERSLRGVGDPTSALEALPEPLCSLSHTTLPLGIETVKTALVRERELRARIGTSCPQHAIMRRCFELPE
jgi:hypothetical protein